MRRKLVLNSGIISLFTGIGVLAGLAIDIIIAARYGLSDLTDAYFIAITIPVVILSTALASGHSVLVVAFKRALNTPHETRLFSTLFTLAILIGLGLALVGTIASPAIVRALSPGRDTELWTVAALLSQIFFWRIPAALLTEILRAALYARQHFAVAAASYCIPGVVAVGLILGWFSADITWVAWSMLIGSWVALVFQIAAFLFFVNNGYRPQIAWGDPDVRQVGRELAAPLAGLLFRQLIVIAERWFGSFLPAGSIAALGYANKITQVSMGILFSSVTTAGLPALTEAIASGQRKLITQQWQRLLRIVSLLALVLGITLTLSSSLLGQLLVRVGIGDFNTTNISEFTFILAIYSLSIIPLGPFRAQQTYFYAARKPHWVAALLALVTVITLALDWPFSQWIGAAGLGLAFTVAATLSALAGALLIRHHQTNIP